MEIVANWRNLVSAKQGDLKKVPVLQVGGPAPAPPTLPVIRVILPHTEACGPTLLQPNCRFHLTDFYLKYRIKRKIKNLH